MSLRRIFRLVAFGVLGLAGCDSGGELAIPFADLLNSGTSTISAQAVPLGGAVPAGAEITFVNDVVKLRGFHLRRDMTVFFGLNNSIARRPNSLMTTIRELLPAEPFVYVDPVTGERTILETQVPFEFVSTQEVLLSIPAAVACSADFTNPILRIFGDAGSSLPVADLYFITGPHCIALAPKEGVDIGGFTVTVHGDFFSPYTQLALRYVDPADGLTKVIGDGPENDIAEHYIDRHTLVVPDWPGVVPDSTHGLARELPADLLLFENIEAIAGNVSLEPGLNGAGACDSLLPEGEEALQTRGVRNFVKADAFTFLPTGVTDFPLIQAVVPDSGPEIGGNKVVLIGQQFDAFTVDLSDPSNPGVGVECPPGSGSFIPPLEASFVDRHTIVITMPPCPVEVPQKVDFCLTNKFSIDNADGKSQACVVFDDVYT
ncbi:MAG: hypothetical protein ACREID_08285, partial [Planctomycetota bacterium]